MTSLFSYLHRSLKVTPLEDGQVQVTVNLHADDFIHFIRILDSLIGFVRLVKNKDRMARNIAAYESEESINERKQYKERYHSRIVELFDRYTHQGLDRTSAIKKISADLRKDKHPWSSPDLVRPSLVEVGRGGRPGRAKKIMVQDSPRSN
ncbi:hypothetical protein SAMN05660420_02249 [Desulfuromusa kysingii]|uniref:Uncharacterized protein n=1 Tax=Desulfuromusa kysingii TaxID=37625 RepID=A0A1H4BJZ7_9BACT|nr:hypothetical protein [Desulfuromusa kysingii]SEA48460.1 hypothetical protein SAMN05660420_02249 [Desulfuromusa kysingii]